MTKQESVQEYLDAIKAMVALKGIETTNQANHLALERGIIRLDQFQAAAKYLVKEYMKRN